MSFKNDSLEIYSGKTIATMDKEYALTLDGKLTPISSVSLMQIDNAKKALYSGDASPAYQYLESDDKHHILEIIDILTNLHSKKFDWKPLIQPLSVNRSNPDDTIWEMSPK